MGDNMAKSGKYGTLSKNTLLFTINSFGSKIITFLLVPLYTYVLTTEDYGKADLMTSTAQLLIPLLTLNIQDAVLRFSLDKVKNRNEVFSVGIAINTVATAFLGLVLLLLSSFNIIPIEREYIVFLFLSFAFGGFYNTLQMYTKAIDKVSILVISGITSTLIICASNLLLLLVFKIGVIGYLISSLLGHLIAAIIMLIGGKIYKDIHIIKDKKLLKEMLVFSSPLVLNSVAWWVNTGSDKYILTFFCGAAVNGVYSVAYKIPSILSTLQMIFYNAWSVSAITEFDKDDKDGFIGNIYSLYSCVSTIGCSFILIFNILLAKILYAKDFFEAWHCVPFLVLGAVFNGLALFDGCLFTAVKRTKEVSRTTLIGAVLNTILNFALIPFIGSIGAALATMLGYCAVWAARTILLRKIIIMKVDWKRQIVLIILLLCQTLLTLFRNAMIFQIPILILIVALQFKLLTNVVDKVLSKVRKHRT